MSEDTWIQTVGIQIKNLDEYGREEIQQENAERISPEEDLEIYFVFHNNIYGSYIMMIDDSEGIFSLDIQ